MNELFRKFSIAAANALGSSWMFIANVFLILVWLFAGPFFHYSDTWQLVVNTAHHRVHISGRLPNPKHAEPRRQGDSLEAG